MNFQNIKYLYKRNKEKMTSKKVTKVEYIYAIKAYCLISGKSAENLNKLSVTMLESVINENNININEYIENRNKILKIQKLENIVERGEQAKKQLKESFCIDKTGNFEYKYFVLKFAVILDLKQKIFNRNSLFKQRKTTQEFLELSNKYFNFKSLYEYGFLKYFNKFLKERNTLKKLKATKKIKFIIEE